MVQFQCFSSNLIFYQTKEAKLIKRSATWIHRYPPTYLDTLLTITCCSRKYAGTFLVLDMFQLNNFSSAIEILADDLIVKYCTKEGCMDAARSLSAMEDAFERSSIAGILHIWFPGQELPISKEESLISRMKTRPCYATCRRVNYLVVHRWWLAQQFVPERLGISQNILECSLVRRRENRTVQ